MNSENTEFLFLLLTFKTYKNMYVNTATQLTDISFGNTNASAQVLYSIEMKINIDSLISCNVK